MDNRANRTTAIFGVILITIGIISLVGHFTNNSPLWGAGLNIALGLVFFAGALAGGRTFSVMAIPGAILTVLGLTNLVQIYFPNLETGIYAWTLIVAAVGLGMALFGRLMGSIELERGGWGVARAGLVFFLVIGIFTEVFFTFTGLSGGPRSILWPVVLIITGLVTLIVRLVRLAQSGALIGGVSKTPDETPDFVADEPAIVIEPRASEDEGPQAVAARAERAAQRAQRRAMRHAARHDRRETDLFAPVLWIGFGILWLQLVLDMLPINNLIALAALWPVLLIAAGISVLFGRRQPVVNLLLGLLIVAGAFYAVGNASQLGLTARSPWAVMGININNGVVTERVAGSGTVISETRAVSDFSGIVLDGGGEVTILKGASAGLTIETDDNLLPYLTSEVRGGRLYLDIKEGTGISPSKLHYTITLNNLEALDVSGAATVTSDPFAGENLDINISGFGALELPQLDYDTLNVQLSGSGSVSASGQADRLNVQISGAGAFDAPNLRSQDADVQISGVGRASVWATNSLSGSISGMGSIGYYGSPNLDKFVGGLGIIRKAGEK